MDSKPTTFHEGDTVSKINSDPTDQILDGEIGIVTELGERYVKVLFIGQEHHFFMPPNKLDVMYCVQPAPAEAAQPVAGDRIADLETELQSTYSSLNACRNEILALREQLAAVTSEKDTLASSVELLSNQRNIALKQYNNLAELFGRWM